MKRKGFTRRDVLREDALDELLAIHRAVMNPMDVKPDTNDTFTLKMVKEFIRAAVQHQ